jgi:hypothetical protein
MIKLYRLIVRYLIALPDGEKKKNAQIHEQFPEGWENVEEAKTDSEELHNVVQGIEKSKTDKEAEPFIEAFNQISFPILFSLKFLYMPSPVCLFLPYYHGHSIDFFSIPH